MDVWQSWMAMELQIRVNLIDNQLEFVVDVNSYTNDFSNTICLPSKYNIQCVAFTRRRGYAIENIFRWINALNCSDGESQDQDTDVSTVTHSAIHLRFIWFTLFAANWYCLTKRSNRKKRSSRSSKRLFSRIRSNQISVSLLFIMSPEERLDEIG
jgi:hypothetical protein